MRTAAMGYLPEKAPKSDTTAGDGGVLRAEMRYVMSKEVDSTDDSFRINPDSAAEGNSGVINYLNKFGDNAPYDVRDPVSELYYTAIRYLRYGAWQWDGTDTDGKPKQKPASGTSPDGALPYSLSAFNNSATEDKNRLKDGFPVIGAETGKWPQDPLRERGDQDADMACYAPSIIVLGDTNTHADNNLPNYPTVSGSDNVASYPNSTRHYYQEVCKLSGFCSGDSGWRVSSGSNGGDNDYAPTFGMAGMAYWVKTNDVRPDISGNQYIDSFFIDVLESNFLKTKGDLYSATKATTDADMQNSYYLAGKFASPIYDANKTYTRDDFDSENEATRSNWTSDPKGESSDANFPLGMPKNYAVANDPTKVRDALIEAFKVVGFTKNTMQSGIQYNSNGELQIAGSQGSDSLVGSAITDNGDGSYTVTDTTTITNKAKNGEVPLSLRAGYRFSQRTGYLTASVLLSGPKDANGVMSGLVEVPVWEAGNILYTTYHKAAYASRKNHVWSKTGTGTAITTGFTNLDPSNQGLQDLVKGSVFEPDENGNYTNYYNDSEKLKTTTARNAENLIKYILGDPSNEGEGGLRQRRDSLLGTSVYSSVTPILKNTEHDFVRTVPLGDYNEKLVITTRLAVRKTMRLCHLMKVCYISSIWQVKRCLPICRKPLCLISLTL
ncbi:MAG: hypothetical protein IJ881_09945, partial [Neisseriaceae bacterium]|nr:hypothetical protein [Neisseriaceae bacterium]